MQILLSPYNTHKISTAEATGKFNKNVNNCKSCNYKFNTRLNKSSNSFISFKANIKLSSEVYKSLKSDNPELKKEYFKRLSENYSLVLRNCTDNEYIKTAQLLLDEIRFEKYMDNELFEYQIDFLSKAIQPQSGIKNFINPQNFIKNSKNFLYDKASVINKINRILRNTGSTERVTLDINSRAEFPINVLSNFTETNFTFDGVRIKSIEGFLQSLKTSDPKKQRDICLLSGIKAKGVGKKLDKERNYDFKNLYWQGKKINRNSETYQILLKEIYKKRFEKDETFRFALEYTQNYKLTHSIGCKDPKRTLLSENEFINTLEGLRQNL